MPPAFDMINIDKQDTRSLKITQAACDRLTLLFQEEKQIDPSANPLLALRVDAGGCSGFQYFLDIIKGPEDNAVILEYKNIKVSIDGPSLDLLQGSYIDFAQELMGAAFVIRNPNAASSCGCGSSFSVF